MWKDTTFPLRMAISTPSVQWDPFRISCLWVTSGHKLPCLGTGKKQGSLEAAHAELSAWSVCMSVWSAENPGICFYCICPNLRIAAVLLWNRAALSFIPTSTVRVLMPGLCENHSSQVNGQGPPPLPLSLRCYCPFSKQLCFSGITPQCLSNCPAFYIIKAEDFISITG